MKDLIIRFLDIFYPLFKRFFNRQTYYYAACGGFNMVLDLLLFFVAYNFIFQKKIVYLTSSIAFEPYIAAYLFSFLFNFPIGFLLSKYVVWPTSNVKGRIQLFRYFMIVLVNLFLNYALLKIFIEAFHIYPTISKFLTIVIIVAFSYISQKYYSFKVKD